MSHFAEIKDNIVQRVIVAEQDFIDSGAVGDPANWVQTSYNTHGGVHKLGGTPLRKNYAGAGYTYDKGRDAFIPPKEYESWVLNETSCLWEPPIPYPALTAENRFINYFWNEAERNWDAIDIRGDST